MKLISLNKVSYNKDSNSIIDNVSLDITESELITIVGPNGAGKTTLLKLIIGNIKATKGKITRSKKLQIGYVPQKLNLSGYLPLSVKNFLSLNKLVIEPEIITQLRIEKLLDKDFNNLSGGELQRVLLARSLLVKPNLLILDEPDQNLDIAGQTEFYEIIEKIHKKYKMAILIVSHNLNMVMAKTEKVYCLYRHICCSGKPEKIKSDPKFTEVFGNKFALYEHHHNHKH